MMKAVVSIILTVAIIATVNAIKKFKSFYGSPAVFLVPAAVAALLPLLIITFSS